MYFEAVNKIISERNDQDRKKISDRQEKERKYQDDVTNFFKGTEKAERRRGQVYYGEWKVGEDWVYLDLLLLRIIQRDGEYERVENLWKGAYRLCSTFLEIFGKIQKKHTGKEWNRLLTNAEKKIKRQTVSEGRGSHLVSAFPIVTNENDSFGSLRLETSVVLSDGSNSAVSSLSQVGKDTSEFSEERNSTRDFDSTSHPSQPQQIPHSPFLSEDDALFKDWICDDQ